MSRFGGNCPWEVKRDKSIACSSSAMPAGPALAGDQAAKDHRQDAHGGDMGCEIGTTLDRKGDQPKNGPSDKSSLLSAGKIANRPTGKPADSREKSEYEHESDGSPFHQNVDVFILRSGEEYQGFGVSNRG